MHRPPIATGASAAPGALPRSVVTSGAVAGVACVLVAAVLTTAISGRAGADTASGGVRIVAGTGRAGDRGVGGDAARAELEGPTGIAVDDAGDLFVADTGNCRVLEIPDHDVRRGRTTWRPGHLYVVAGDGCGRRQAPPGTPATESGVGFDGGVAVDRDGDVVIADTSGNRILVVAGSTGRRWGLSMRSGGLYTVAGQGNAGSGGDGGPARRARLDDPQGVAVDAVGDVFVADTANCRVREVAAAATPSLAGMLAAGAIDTVAGSGRCGTPAGPGVDGDGGPAADATVWDPTAVAVDAAGDLLVADSGDAEVREVAARSGTFFGVAIAAGDIATVAGSGTGYGPYVADGLPATGETAGINFPEGVALDSAGDLLIADGDDSAVREVWARPGRANGAEVATGAMTTVVGALLAGPEDASTRWVRAPIADPWGVATDARGNIFVSDRRDDTVIEVPADPGAAQAPSATSS